MVPLTSDWISFMIFIASIMQTTEDSVMTEPLSAKGFESGEGAR